MLFGAAAFWILAPFFPKQRVDGKDWWLFILGGLILAATLIVFSEAFRFTSPCYMSLMSATSPLLVMLMAAVFLKEPISFRKSAGVLFGIGGALMIVLFSLSNDANATPVGLLLCFLNILFYAIYLIVTRRISQKYSPVTLMKWMFLIGSVICLPLAVPHVRESPMLYQSAPAIIWVSFIFVLVFSTVVAYFLLPVGLRYLRPTTVSMYSNLQPVVTSCVAIAFGQDIFTWNKPVALVLIIIGVYLVTTSRARGESKK